MAVNRKGKEVADSKAAAPFSPAASSSGRGKRKRPISVASPSASSSSRTRGAPKKRGRASSSRFIDDAAVDADDDDSEEFDDDGDDDSAEEDAAEFMNDVQAGLKGAKGAGKSSIPCFLKVEELSGDELEEFVNERYGHGSDYVEHAEDDKEHDERNSLLHSPDDPTLWRVRCMVGHERQIAFCLIQKFVSLRVLGSNLPIISAFSLEHIKGYVYIEADKQHDVAEACKGFCNLYASKIGLVPINEVPRLLSVQNKSNEIAEGSWVRMKSGKYKGDLAQIVTVDDVRKRATVKLVPRIDLQALAKKFGGGVSLKQASIPAPRLISCRELEDFRPHIEVRRDRDTGELFEILDGLMLKDGYLYKKVSILSLNCFGVQPSSAELTKFEPAKRDEPQVSEYISHLYGGHKKNSLETMDTSLEEKENTFKLHDLVLFGRKDFGVIIDMKADSFQILKGGMVEPAVVSVPRKEIKKSCIDKMFTASDSHMKTIYINDTVKVLEGPQKGRQGIVKHMYKGSLFIYEEEDAENTGFFCVKSEFCEVMKSCRQTMGHKSYHIGSKGCAESSSMPLSPTRCSQQRDYDSGVKRYRPDDRDQPFTIGQTLRIRVGPLKGYLCRVVRISRSDVTVKLDSLVKLITVNCNHLSDATIKSFGNARDDASSKTEQLGSEEGLFKGELVNEETKSSWDFELPSSARASWPGLSTWGGGGSSANSGENKACNDQGDDPWGSKMTSVHSDNAAEQPSHPATTEGWSNWAKAEKSTEDEHENWKGKSTSEGEKSGWSKVLSSNNDKAGNWNRGTGAGRESDGGRNWGSHTDRPGHSEMDGGSGDNREKSDTDGWSNRDKAVKSTESEHDGWKGNSINEHGTSGWSKATSSNYAPVDSWSKSAGATGGSVGMGGWEGLIDRQGHSETLQGGGSNWAKTTTDAWSKRGEAEKSTEGEHENWKGNNLKEDETGGWNRVASSNHHQAESWNKGPCSNGESDGKMSLEGHNRSDGWSKWNKAEKSTEGANESWKGTNTNEGETGHWSKARSSNHDQTDRWNKGAGTDKEFGSKVNWGCQSDRSACFEAGQGSGFDRGGDGNIDSNGNGNQSGGWGRRSDYGGGNNGSSWGRGRGRAVGGYGDKQDCWNRSRDSDGGRDRGRGRSFGGSGPGRNQEDSWKGSGYSNAGWNSGRGRGRRGRGVWEAGGSRDDCNDSSHFGRGGNQSSGWKNDHGSSGYGGFSVDALPSWKSDQSSSWDKSTVFGKTEAFDDKKGQNNSWGGKEPFGGGSSSWNTGRENPGGSGNGGGWERGEKSNINLGCSANSGWDSDKLGGGHDKHIDGEPPASSQKEATSKWSTAEACENKQSSWSHAPCAEETAGDKGWSIEAEPSGADQSGGHTSASSGHQSFVWATKPTVNEKVSKDGGAGGSWDTVEQAGRKEESALSTEKREGWNLPKDSGKQYSAWQCSAEHGAKSSATAADNWEKGNKFPDRKSSDSADWHITKAFDGSGSSDWSRKTEGDGGKESGGVGMGNPKPSGHECGWASQGSSGRNWTSPKPSSGGEQGSDCHRDGGNNWNKPKHFSGKQSSDWTSWPSGGGASRNDDRPGDWSGGKPYGSSQSSGWRANVSSGGGNGRGRGKCFRQDQPSGWRGETHPNREAGGAGFSEFSSRQESYGRAKPSSWSDDKFANEGSGSRDGLSGCSTGKDHAGEQSSAAKNWTNREGVWRQETSDTWGRRDSGTSDGAGGFDHSDWKNPSASTSGWTGSRPVDSDHSNAKTSAWGASKDAGWEQKKCPDGAQGSDVWTAGAISSQKASGEACRETDNWNKPKGFNSGAARGWNSAPTSTKETKAAEDQAWNQKDSDRAGGPGCWGNNNVSAEEFRQNITQRDAWSGDGAHGSGEPSGWEGAKDGKVGKGGW